MPFAPGRLLARQPLRAARAFRTRRHRVVVLAAVLAIVCALVPDPVTVARAPTAYVPLDGALFTPIALGAPLPAATPGLAIGPADPIADGPFTGAAMTRATDGAAAAAGKATPLAPPRGASGAQVGHVAVAWRTTEVSWYGPGFYGQRTACGEAMTTTLVGVAHRTLPCGTLVEFRYDGRVVKARVVDRGPYVSGRLWDLTAGLCALLGHCFTGPISWKVT